MPRTSLIDRRIASLLTQQQVDAIADTDVMLRKIANAFTRAEKSLWGAVTGDYSTKVKQVAFKEVVGEALRRTQIAMTWDLNKTAGFLTACYRLFSRNFRESKRLPGYCEASVGRSGGANTAYQWMSNSIWDLILGRDVTSTNITRRPWKNQNSRKMLLKA